MCFVILCICSKKRAEHKGPSVTDENIERCYRANKINWSNGHTYFHHSAWLLQPEEYQLTAAL